MRLELENWYLGYGQILMDCRRRGGGGKALILCHADVDAMAAARILTYMLRADQVEYVLVPCCTSTQLEKHARGDAYASIILLNVGGTKNLTRLFGLQEEGGGGLKLEQTKVYVLDQRRPIHLANIYAEDHVVVFWDPTHGNADELPADGDNLSGGEEEESDDDEEEEEDSSSDEEEEEDNDEEGEQEMEFDAPAVPKADAMDIEGEEDGDRITPQKKNKKKQRSDGHETDSTEEEDMESPATSPTQAVTETPLPTMTPAQKHEQRQHQLKVYYNQGSTYGSPTSFVAYQISQQLRFGSLPDLLWLCMVGVTDAYLQARLDVLGYAPIADALSEACLKIFPPINALERAETTVYAEELLVSNSMEDSHKTKLTFSERGRILPQTDFRCFLLRQSSLLDALQCSPYVSTQMQLWTKHGMQNLHELLARMGYPLTECKQPYSFLKPSLRRQLHPKLNQYKDEYNLDELEFTSFVRVTGFSSLTSASDVCYAASALLECPLISSTPTTKQLSTPSNDSSNHQNKNNNNHNAQQQDWELDCFHAAYDALGSHTTHSAASSSNAVTTTTSLKGRKATASFQTGLQWATQLQRLILATAVRLVSTNAITRLRHFRYAYITTTSSNPGEQQTPFGENPQDTSTAAASTDYHVLAKPLALTRLAHYLMDMHRANGKWVGSEKRQLPLVLLAEQPATCTYLIAGYEMPAARGHLQRNKLGQHFSIAASTFENAVARLESFDAHVVEVSASHAQRFLEQLHYILDNSV